MIQKQKRNLALLLCFLILLTSMLSACSSGLEPVGGLAEEETETVEQITQEIETEEEITEEETTTENVIQYEEEEKVQTTPLNVKKPHPSSDDTLCILLIGNSFCTGWPDDLKALFDKEGIKAEIFTVYYAGCTLQQHWTWLQGDKGNYRLAAHNASTMVGIEKLTLRQCLRRRNWDVISLQQHFEPTTAGDLEATMKTCTPYANNLFNYLKEQCPQARFLWHQTWSYDLGFEKSPFKMDSVEYQTLCHQNIRSASHQIANENNTGLVPCGDAWQNARAAGSGLLTKEDLYHDGPETGGQFLNACVWYEVLTGKSCLDNKWVPALDADRVELLKNAAHQAVLNCPIKR